MNQLDEQARRAIRAIADQEEPPEIILTQLEALSDFCERLGDPMRREIGGNDET